MAFWNDIYNQEQYVFGREPSTFLVERAGLFASGGNALSVAEGEGRNAVYLARQGLDVLAIDVAENGLRKAHQLATDNGVAITTEQVDLAVWDWPSDAYDFVVGIFIHFNTPELRRRLFDGMKRAAKPGGLVLLHGYRPEQINYRTGGPPNAEWMYSASAFREAFSDFEIVELTEEDREITEGTGHRGMSALINLVARKPLA